MRGYVSTSILLLITSGLMYAGCGGDDDDGPDGSAGSGEAGAVHSAGEGNLGGAPASVGGHSNGGSDGPIVGNGGAETGSGDGGSGDGGSDDGGGGEGGSGSPALGGAGGVDSGGAAGAGGSGDAGDSGGPGGSGGTNPGTPPLPTACPGVIEDYSFVEGTSSNETFGLALLTAGADFVHGRGGNDVLHASGGDDCYVGAAGMDRLEHGIAGDGTDYLIGGPDRDDFVLIGTGGSAEIIDFGAAQTTDVIIFVRAGFGLTGAAAGAIPAPNRQTSASDLSAGANSGLCAAATPCIIYDSTDGEILFDADGASAGSAALVARIRGFQNLTFDWANLELE
jgi:hypothetical protein